jgi:uncharacterized membrane protein
MLNGTEPIERELSSSETSVGAFRTETWQRIMPIASLLALVVVGVALRFIGITRQSIWLDEAFSTYLAAHPFPVLLHFVAGSDAHPPLYYLVLHIWLVFGPSALAMRSLSALASSAALVMMFLVGRRVANQRVAFLATGFMALSAFQVWYAQEVRMYALTTLAILVAVYALVRAWQGGGFGAWVLFIGAMLAGLYLDYSAVYIFGALVIWFVAIGWQRLYFRRPFLLSGTAIILGYLPWLPSMWRQLFQIGGLTAWIGGSAGSGLTGVFADLLFNHTNLAQSQSGILPLVASAASLALVTVALWVPRHEPGYPLLGIWLGFPCALGVAAGILGHPILIARNVMVIQPALFLLLALAVEIAWRTRPGVRPARVRMALLVLGVGVVTAANIAAEFVSWNTTLKEDWPGAAALVATNQHPGDLVLFNAYFTEMPFDYYFRNEGTLKEPIAEKGYQLEESLLFVNPAKTSKSVKTQADAAAYARVWVVLSHTGMADDSLAVPPWINTGYRLAREWHLVGVTVQLYVVRVT